MKITMLAFARSALRKLAVSLTLVAVVLPSVATAQAASGALPTYARPAPVHETITGSIASFDGKYALALNDDRGFVDSVQLRDGTIINPTGLRLIEGMRVTITGYTAGKIFVALQIDTPYTITNDTGAGPAPAYGYGYGYPYYGGGYYGGAYYGGYYPWYYPVAAFGIGFAFGSLWPYYGGYYGYRGGYYGGYYGYRGGYYGYGYRGGYGWGGGYHNPANPYGGGGWHGSNGGWNGSNGGGYHGSTGGYHGSSGGGRGFSGGHR